MNQRTYKPFATPATKQKPNKKAEINRLFYFVGGGGKKVHSLLPKEFLKMGGIATVGGRGRKPKLTKLRELNGNAGKRPLNTNEPKFSEIVDIEPPEWLSDLAVEMWHDGNWQTLPKISGQSVDIDGIYAGKYLAQVQAVDSFDNESLPTTSQLTAINGKIGKPPRLAKFAVKGILFGMQMDWTFARGSEDTNFTEIQVSPDGRSNIATLGTFSYPTNSHTINGLQGNLTQFYRARIVDKLGNTSDWTAWTKGVTGSSADKVLDLLNGQITQSQLHQDLVTPIAKIPTLETGITAINGKLPTLENSIASINSCQP